MSIELRDILLKYVKGTIKTKPKMNLDIKFYTQKELDLQLDVLRMLMSEQHYIKLEELQKDFEQVLIDNNIVLVDRNFIKVKESVIVSPKFVFNKLKRK